MPFFGVMMSDKKYLTRTAPVLLIASLCCLLWGSAFPMINVGYNYYGIDSSDTATIILFAGIRFFLAGVLTIAIFSVASKKLLIPKRSSLPYVGVLSVFQTILQYVFFYLGLAFTTGTRASVINGSGVLFVLIISCFVIRTESFSFRKAAACILGFLGIALSSFSASDGFSFNKGDLFIIITAISYATSTVLMRKFSAYENPAVLSGYQFIVGGAVMSAFAFVFGGRLDLANIKGIAVLVYLAFVSAIAYSLWSILLKYNDASRISICGTMTPIFGFLLSLLILHEQGNGILMNGLGLILVVSGMAISSYKRKSDCNQH